MCFGKVVDQLKEGMAADLYLLSNAIVDREREPYVMGSKK